MVKLYCDRCGKEIKDKHYYTINIHKEELVKQIYSSVAYASATSNVNVVSIEEDVLAKLNSQTMYCEECKEKIEACICNCDYRYL